MKIALLGDIALFGKCTIPEYFTEIGEYLSTFDFVLGNLETPFSIKKKPHGAKSAYICANVECVGLLKQLHLKAVSLANNHMFDYGQEGYETTKRLLKENRIDYFGTEGHELTIEYYGNKIAFSGFCCYTSNPLKCVPYGQYGVNEYNIEKVRDIISDHANKGYLNIVSVHAGMEHVNYPSLDHIHAARQLTTVAPIIYYGHHPHVVQGIENREESLLAYSLGNFCFDDVYSSASKDPLITLSENNRSSCILIVNIENSKIISWDITPIYIGKDKIHIGHGVTLDSIAKYTAAFQNMDSLKYKDMRSSFLKKYYESRKQKRNFIWYVKRLRPRYAKILLNAKKNAKRYQKCVIDNL